DHFRTLERLKLPEVHHGFQPDVCGEELSQRRAEVPPDPTAGGDERELASGSQQLYSLFEEVNEDVGDPVVALESALPVGLERGDPFLPDVGRVAGDDVEAALGEDFGEGGLPVEGFGMHRLIADDAVALTDDVIEAGQALAARGGLDPEAELADLDGLGVEVHAVEVVLENLPVEVEEGAVPAQFLQPGVGA